MLIQQNSYDDFFDHCVAKSINIFFAVFNEQGKMIEANPGFRTLVDKFGLQEAPSLVFQVPTIDYFINKIGNVSSESGLIVNMGKDNNTICSLVCDIKYDLKYFCIFGQADSFELMNLNEQFIQLNNETQVLYRQLKKNETLLGASLKEVQTLLEEKKLLMKEIHHRIKNNMNSICILLMLQRKATKETAVSDTLLDAENRVKSMMILYEKLYNSNNIRQLSTIEYLPDLVSEILSSFPNNSQIKIVNNISDFILDVDVIQPLGMFFVEILTNIMKYAFIGRKEGIITTSVFLDMDYVTIEIADNGSGMPEDIDIEKSTGFGMTLIAGLAKQLCGEIKIERKNGTKIILRFKHESKIEGT